MGSEAILDMSHPDSRSVNLCRLMGQAVLEAKSSLLSFPYELGKLRDENAGDVTTDRLNPSR